jgi:hypothetical protein
MKKILGIDLSTSAVGFALFTEDAKILELTHATPICDDISEEMARLHKKSLLLRDFIKEKGWVDENVSTIVIESPLISKNAVNTAAMLQKFHGMFYSTLKTLYDSAGFSPAIEYIGERDARLYAMPELHKGKKNTLWSSVPQKMAGKPIKDYRKLLVILQMAQRFPEIEWSLNNNKTINDKNADRADAMATAFGYMVKNGLWKNKDMDLDKSLKFLESYLPYLEWIKDIKGNSDEKKALKAYHLNKVIKINDFINIPVFV